MALRSAVFESVSLSNPDAVTCDVDIEVTASVVTSSKAFDSKEVFLRCFITIDETDVLNSYDSLVDVPGGSLISCFG